MMNKTSVVLTTINNVTKNILNIEKGCKKKNWNLIIIGDKKSPKNFKLRYGKFFNILDQNKLNLSYPKKSLVNSYARKNIGYLLSIKNGAEIIIETDDDNYPLKNFFQDRKIEHEFKQIQNKGWINIYDVFKRDDKLIWPRGLPLNEILLKKKFIYKKIKKKCIIQQGLCDLNPDVDAIFRLINKEIKIQFKKKLYIGIKKNSICPFNSQNTTWFKRSFPLLYLPSFCSMRATDIWRSIIAQRIIYNDNKNLLFHSSNVFQKRNAHNLMQDFNDEITVYKNINYIYSTLKKIRLAKGHHNYLKNIEICYRILCEKGFFPKKEMILVKAWGTDIKKLSVKLLK